MQILIRQRLANQGNQEFLDTPLSAATLQVGAGAHCDVLWLGERIAAEHFTLASNGQQIELRCARGVSVTIAGKATRQAFLNPGDEVNVEGNRLRVIAPPSGFDAAFEVAYNEQADPALFERAYRTDLTATWLSSRSAAWTLAILIAAIALAIPLFNAKTAPQSLAAEWLPSVRMWSSGPLHEAHQLVIGDDCGACHVKLFERVPDTQCLTCHAVSDHLLDSSGQPRPLTAGAGTFHGAESGAQRCATCHQEHNEPAHLVLSNSAQCTDCHDEGVAADLAAVQGFGTGEHPEFSPTLLQPVASATPGGVAVDWRAQRVALADAKENSQLSFSHALHLNVDKVARLDSGGELQCGSCHEPGSDSAHFSPVRMEQHCQGCHSLAFDPTNPGALLPHGEPAEVILAMEGHFLRQLVDERTDVKARTRRRIPDRSPPAPACTGTAFECAQFFTRREAEQQFADGGCATCHAVTDLEGDDLHTRYQVMPVRLAQDFLPRARFDHRSHATLPDTAGDAACESCHKARRSTQASDLLLPSIASCQQCHGNLDDHGKVGMECVSCHDFHRQEHSLLPPSSPLSLQSASIDQ